MTQKTTLMTPREAGALRRWHHVDARGKVLGRMATNVATLLRGKHKVEFHESTDCGDFVIVTNAKHIRLTGDKLRQKTYFTHSGYAGGKKVTPMWRVMDQNPCRVVKLAVRRMLPDNRLRARQMTRLKIYAEDKHPFTVKATS